MTQQLIAGVHFIAPKTPAELLADAQAVKIREINDAYTDQAEPLIKDYPEVEQATWLAQEAEARLYLEWHLSQQNDPPKSPLLEAILSGRNGDSGSESLYELCIAVKKNADRFTKFQVLTGKRQRLIKKIRQAATIEEVESIVF